MDHNQGFLRLVEAARSQIRECTVADVQARQERREPFHFIDVREDNEYAAEHAAGARHLGRGIIERDIERLIPDRAETIVLYCGGGFRSALAAESLQKMGYANVLSLAGGFRALREARFPMER